MAVNLFNQIYEIIWGISKEKDKMAADPGRIEAQLQLMVSDAALGAGEIAACASLNACLNSWS
ncbi:hypothetical protein IH785_08225 [candidate division KSB1 bacterium]|nr:hypothetical protein [candidate division KSB1 bacterium]